MAGAGKGVTHAGAGRPTALFPLFAGLETLPGVGPKAAEAFAQMGVTRPRDLILTLPHSGIRRRRIARLAEARPPEIVTLVVAVLVGLAAWQRGPTTLAPSVPVHVPTLAVALPLILLWALSPVVAHALSAPALRRALRLAADERDRAMRYALFHWRFFERFVGEATQWLAPDNYQETPEPIVALRTSFGGTRLVDMLVGDPLPRIC